MMRIGLFGLVLLLSGVPLLGQIQRTDAIPLLPAADWRLVASQRLNLDEVRPYGHEPAVDREYGVKSAELRTYQLGARKTQVLVEQAGDAASAFGLLTYYQSEAMTPEKSLQLAVSNPDFSLMARGRFFIRALRPAGGQFSENEFRALLILVGGTRPSAETLNALPIELPRDGLVKGSEKYLLGIEAARKALPSFRTDLLGFANGAELYTANYTAGKQRVTALVIAYPTPQTARLRFGALRNFLAINEDRGVESVYGKRNGSFVFLVTNVSTRAAAEQVLAKFNVAEQVSWNERYPDDKPIALQLLELFLANIFLILALVGISLAGGLSIVLSRRIAAKWFPNSSWGHPERDVFIYLKLR